MRVQPPALRGYLAAALTACAGLTLLTVAAITMAHDRRLPQDFGATTAPRLSRLAPSRPTPARTSPAPATPALLSPPAALTIPALHVHAAVVPVGVSHRVLAVPADPAQVGWWTDSVLPGATAGSTVIDGHVDSAAAGPGALFRLGDLQTGDPVAVTTGTGDRRTYAVTGRRVYVKAAGLPPDLFTTTGAPRLVLISCGGPFNYATGSYLDNIVIFAVPT